MANISIKEAMQRVADNPLPSTDEIIQLPVHEMVCRSLFDIANRPDAGVRGSLTRANKARKMILDRLVGRRRPGSHPATRNPVDLTFVDLTGGALDGPSQDRADEPDGRDPVDAVPGATDPPGAGSTGQRP